MTVDEARQQALDTKAREVFGMADGATFMEMLADTTTKDDLAAFETRLDRRFEAIGRRFDAVDHRFEVLDHQWQARFERELRQFNTRLTAMMATFVMGGMVLAAGVARIGA